MLRGGLGRGGLGGVWGGDGGGKGKGVGGWIGGGEALGMSICREMDGVWVRGMLREGSEIDHDDRYTQGEMIEC